MFSEGHEGTVILIEYNAFQVLRLLLAVIGNIMLFAISIEWFPSECLYKFVANMVLLLKKQIFVHYNDKFNNYINISKIELSEITPLQIWINLVK